MTNLPVSPSVFGRAGTFPGTRETSPMIDINTTPLIDVMLVLLIMFIITVPTQSHRIPLNLPGPVPPQLVRPLSNELGLSSAGALSWNGRAIDDAMLKRLLSDVASRAPQPEVHFRPDAAVRYERVDEVLGIAAQSGASSFGFSGNERFKDNF